MPSIETSLAPEAAPIKTVSLFRSEAPAEPDHSPTDTSVVDAVRKVAREANQGREESPESPAEEKSNPPVDISEEEGPDPAFLKRLKEREARARILEDAHEQAKRIKAEAFEEAKRAREDAVAEARRELRQRFRTEPTKAIKDLEVDHQALIKDVIDEQKPEFQQQVALRKMQERIDQLEAREKAFQEERQTHASRAQKQQAEATFVQSATADKLPNARLLYASDADLLKAAYDVSYALQAEGKACDDASIMQALEERSTQWVDRLRDKLGAPTKPAPGLADKAKVRTPSAAQSSERRSAPSLQDEDDEELARIKRAMRATSERWEKDLRKKATST